MTDAKVGCILYKFVLLFIHVVYHGYYNEENTVRGVFSFIIALFIFGYVCIVYVLRILKKKKHVLCFYGPLNYDDRTSLGWRSRLCKKNVGNIQIIKQTYSDIL